jgi:anionic cell wall polymer biosynthesis LytR-Cps2A-Psr (LCP) family protein
VLAAVKTKLISLQTFENLPAFFELAVKHTKTDLDLEIVKYLAPALINARNYEIKTIVLSTENVFTPGTSASGQSIVVPKQDWNQVRAYLHAEMQAN